MALSLSDDFKAALADTARLSVGLFTFEFGTGTYGLQTGKGVITYNGLSYMAGGSAIDISQVQQVSDGSVTKLTLTLSAAPKKGLPADVLATFFDEDWHMRPVTIQLALLDPVTRAVIDNRTLFRGSADVVTYQEGPGDGSSPNAALVMTCVSRSLNMSLAGNLYRNAATQLRFSATDTSLVGIGTLNGEISVQSKWGQST